MEEAPLKAVFESNLDELVDTSVRLSMASRTLRRTHSTAVLGTAAAAGIAWFVAFVSRMDRWVPLFVAIGAISGVALGVAVGLVYRIVYDRGIRRRIRGVLLERLGNLQTLGCEVELRPDVAWARQDGTEMSFSWRDASGVRESDDAIELSFKGGIIVVRDRAFASPALRQNFLERARILAGVPRG